jgi:Domain of unknown function (DUF2019)
MTNADLRFLTVDQLVDRFAAIGVEQDKAEQAEHDSKYKQLFYEMSDIQEELKRRPGDQRRAGDALRLSKYAGTLKGSAIRVGRRAGGRAANDRGHRCVDLAASVLRRAQLLAEARRGRIRSRVGRLSFSPRVKSNCKAYLSAIGCR